MRQRTFTLKAAVRQLQQEMSQREQAELQMQHNALHDPLTGLPNRDYILNVLNSMAATAKGTQDDARVAVLWVDLDRFKVINGSMGHQAGNQVLIAVAQRLRICVQTQGGLVGRFGGDEFVIVLPRVRDRRLAEAVAQQVHQNLGDPLMINQQQVFVTASIGISLGNVNKRSGDAILRDSNLFMRRAKMMGRSRNATFDPAIHQQMLADLHLENDLRQAVSELEGSCLEDLTEGSYLNQRDSPFKLHYQPIVDLKTGRIRAFEALIRWQHPSLGNISPGQFIPIAEETGVIEPLGLWILSQACHQLRLWQTELRYPQLEVSVNLSCRQFSQHNLLDHVDAVLGETGLDPRRLKIEITESTLADNYSTAMTVLHELHDRSIQLCMDDFGTGYSSLSYLDRFPLDVLKIDRSFVNRLKGKSNKAAIVRAILGMAESLGMNAIAEGVETPEQLRTLNHLGCRYIQGYFYSPAVDARSAQQLLLSHYDPLATESSSPVEFKNDWPREEKLA
ncbi:MAG: putative bifunctional diguanylate cyclase/phosphodiesterase [Cyanophyceae cyanobacterium]